VNVWAERSKIKKNIYIFICRLSVISEKVTEERGKKFQKNDIETIPINYNDIDYKDRGKKIEM